MAPKTGGEEPTSTTTVVEDQPQQQEGETSMDQEDETIEQKTEKATTSLAEGKRHYLSNSFADACKALANSCQYHAAVYGDFGVECADAYIYYGKSLLELARMEPGVFSNALQGVVEEEDSSADEGEGEAVGDEDSKEKTEETEGHQQKETPTEEDTATSEEKKDDSVDEQFEDPDKLTEEEREDLHEMVEEALEENAEALEQGKVPDEKQEEQPTVQEEAEVTKEGETAETTEEEGAEGDEEGAGEEAQEPESTGGAEIGEEKIGDESIDVSNLQLAWEMLDMARVICQKQKGKEWREKLSDCLLTLGEVAIEDERYEKAVEDLGTCLKIQKEVYETADRHIAETFFQMGRAQNLLSAFGDAADSFRNAVEVLEARKTLLESQLKEQGAGDESSKKREEISKEIKELEDLIPDIRGKLADMEESQKSAEERRREMEAEEKETGGNKEGATTAIGFEDSGDSDKPATNITHLVRKPLKRKPEEEMEGAKRSKTDVMEENGQAEGEKDVVNGHSNDQHESAEGEVQG